MSVGLIIHCVRSSTSSPLIVILVFVASLLVTTLSVDSGI